MRVVEKEMDDFICLELEEEEKEKLKLEDFEIIQDLPSDTLTSPFLTHNSDWEILPHVYNRPMSKDKWDSPAFQGVSPQIAPVLLPDELDLRIIPEEDNVESENTKEFKLDKPVTNHHRMSLFRKGFIPNEWTINPIIKKGPRSMQICNRIEEGLRDAIKTKGFDYVKNVVNNFCRYDSPNSSDVASLGLCALVDDLLRKDRLKPQTIQQYLHDCMEKQSEPQIVYRNHALKSL